MKTTIAAVLSLSAIIVCAPSLAGETFSQTFYTGEDSAIDQASTQAIHFDHFAEIAAATVNTTSASPLRAILLKAVSESKLERPVYTRGFNMQTVSTAKGLSFSAAYRF